MKKNHKSSYPFAVLLNTVSTFVPFVAAVFAISEHQKLEAGSENHFKLCFILLLVDVFQALVLRIPLKKLLVKSIKDNEYDEFGRSKKKSFENLTRKEREQLDLQKTAQLEQLLPKTVLEKLIHEGSSNPEKELNELIGLNDVKRKISEMAARMKFEKETKGKSLAKDKSVSQYGMNGRHFCFYGSAGTGKTSIARIVAGFLYEYGYIKQNKCIEINGGFLKAGELSETKTKLIIQQAYGGVLFIDEAYSIMEGNANYGKAVVATLIKEMEDNRDKFTVILAGYKNDMKRLLDSNEGFKSRIKEYLEFPDYSVPEMKEIFENMAHAANFVVSAGALENFEIRAAKEKNLPSFGNGRTVRNVLDECIDKHALNYSTGVIGKDEKFLLCSCDVSTVPNRNVL